MRSGAPASRRSMRLCLRPDRPAAGACRRRQADRLRGPRNGGHPDPRSGTMRASPAMRRTSSAASTGRHSSPARFAAAPPRVDRVARHEPAIGRAADQRSILARRDPGRAIVGQGQSDRHRVVGVLLCGQDVELWRRRRPSGPADPRPAARRRPRRPGRRRGGVGRRGSPRRGDRVDWRGWPASCPSAAVCHPRAVHSTSRRQK